MVTDLASRFPIDVAAVRIGNSGAITVQHCLQVREEDFARAITEPWRGANSATASGMESGTVSGRKSGTAGECWE